MRRSFVLVLCVLLGSVWTSAQEAKPLTNDDVVQMFKAGFSDEMLVKAIETQPAAFDTSAQALISLKNAGLSEVVISTMLGIANGGSPVAAPSPEKRPVLLSNLPGESAEKRLPALFVEEVSSDGSVMAASDTRLEAIKTLQKRGMRVVTTKEKADYILQITRQLGKKSWSKDTKIVLSSRDGEVVYSNSTRSVGGAMGDVVDYINNNHM